jgi:hypothetical protein
LGLSEPQRARKPSLHKGVRRGVRHAEAAASVRAPSTLAASAGGHPRRIFVALVIGVTLTVWLTQFVLRPKVLLVVIGLGFIFRLSALELFAAVEKLSGLEFVSLTEMALPAPFALQWVVERRPQRAEPR